MTREERLAQLAALEEAINTHRRWSILVIGLNLVALGCTLGALVAEALR